MIKFLRQDVIVRIVGDPAGRIYRGFLARVTDRSVYLLASSTVSIAFYASNGSFTRAWNGSGFNLDEAEAEEHEIQIRTRFRFGDVILPRSNAMISLVKGIDPELENKENPLLLEKWVKEEIRTRTRRGPTWKK